MMQYYRIGETLEPLESLPPEEKSILAVLCPEELPGALLPQGLTPPQPPEDLRENQYCWLHIRQGALAGEVRLPQRGAQSVRRLAFALAGESLLLVDHNGYAAECLKQLTLPTGHALTADELLAELLTALTQNDLPMLQGLESRLTTLEQGVLADDTDKFIHKMSAIRRELNRENRFYAQLGDFAETMQEDAAELLGHRAQRRVGYFTRRVGTLRSETQMLREYATQISGEYQAQVDILQNRVMKLLTIVTTIFLPLSLIVGWYGMNFDMPELSWEYGYPVIIVVAVAVVVLLVRYFRRKKWL